MSGDRSGGRKSRGDGGVVEQAGAGDGEVVGGVQVVVQGTRTSSLNARTNREYDQRQKQRTEQFQGDSYPFTCGGE